MYTFTRKFLHDLRSSLGVIMLSASGIAPEHDCQQNSLLNISREAIIEQTRSMAKLIDNTDRIFALHYNKVETRPTPLNIVDFTSQVVSEYNAASKAEIQFCTDSDDLTIEIDPLRYREALIYLLETVGTCSLAKNRIEVHLAHLESGAGVRLAIIDPSLEVPSDRQALIFKPFTHIQASREASGQENGLGLYLAKLIIEELLHGTVALTRYPQKGTQFEIELPAGSPAPVAARHMDWARTYSLGGKI